MDLSHGGKEDAPSSEVMRKGDHPGKNPRGVPAPPKVRIDEEGGNRAATGSKGEEEHQTPKGAPPAEAGNEGPQRVVISRRGRPVRACTKCNTEPTPFGTCGSIKKVIERLKSSCAIFVRRHSNGAGRQGGT